MSLLTIVVRSFLVLVVLALMVLPIRFEMDKADVAEAAENGETLEIAEPQTPEILSRPVYAYLADESQGILSASYRPANDTANRLSVARTLAEQKQFEKALIILGNVKEEDAPSYDVRFLRARILSWGGQHDAADYIFRGLRAEFPHDPDVMVSHGYLKYYQGQHRDAEYLFSQVLISYPGYVDARNGLNRVRKARQGQ